METEAQEASRRQNSALARYSRGDGCENAVMQAIATIALEAGFSQESLAKTYSEASQCKIGSEGVQRHFASKHPRKKTVDLYAKIVGLSAERRHLIEGDAKTVEDAWMRIVLSFLIQGDIETSTALRKLFSSSPDACKTALLRAQEAWEMHENARPLSPGAADIKWDIRSGDSPDDILARNASSRMHANAREQSTLEREDEEYDVKRGAVLDLLSGHISVTPYRSLEAERIRTSLVTVYRALEPVLTYSGMDTILRMIVTLCLDKPHIPLKEMVDALQGTEYGPSALQGMVFIESDTEIRNEIQTFLVEKMGAR